jgi:phosphate transport system permease protein
MSIPRRQRLSSTAFFSWGFSLFALFSLLVLILLLVVQSWPAWQEKGITLVTGTEWFYRHGLFGAAPMIYGSLIVALIALLIAIPLGVGSAIFIAEYLPRKFRLAFKIIIEMLAGIPSVVYGLLGILLLRNWVYQALESFHPLSGDTLLTAGILLGIMILPTMMTLSDDALNNVPSLQRMAARGLGLTQTEVALHVSLPQAWPGLMAAFLLGLGRALGEMIAVFLVIGRQDNQWPGSFLSFEPLIQAGQSLSTKLGGSEINIAYGDPFHWAAMMALGLILLTLVLSITFLAICMKRQAQHDV